MKGWLIYDEEGAKRNEWFISRLQSEAAALGMTLRLRIYDGNERFFDEEKPDFAIVRSILPAVNARLESLGIRVFNNAETARVACDKWQTYLLCKELQIPVLETSLAEEDTGEYPKVLKSRDGHGGTEVFWTHSRAEVKEYMQQGKRYVLQQPSDTLGKDVRVYALGNTIVAAVLRTSQTDFRSNFSLGGNVELTTPTKEQKKIVQTLYNRLHFDFAGIDFLPHQNGYVVNEIEDAAGTRMLYRCSNIDMAKVFMEYVKTKV